jgi:hypothetical protein
MDIVLCKSSAQLIELFLYFTSLKATILNFIYEFICQKADDCFDAGITGNR